MNKIIGKNIKTYRIKQNITQEELASKINIDRTTLSHYETGNRLPSILILCDIADCLHVTLDELVGRC